MKAINTFLILSVFSITAKSVTYISDLDDTIKITNVKSPQAVQNAFFSTDVFLGMSELMRSFKSSPENRLFIVSGSFEFFHGKIAKLMSVNGIKPDYVYLVNGTPNKPTTLDMLVGNAKDEVILLGDDQERDPQYYRALQAKYPEKIKAVYIHQLNDVLLPNNQMGFISAYEVAVREATAQRLSRNKLNSIRDYFAKNLRFKWYDFLKKSLLIPHWQECNQNSLERVLDPVRSLPLADLNILNEIEEIAMQNCDD